ncbi:TPA: methyltransferase [Clostridium perfringens]|nr:methyltransferase [Clostridium perfringens]
MFNFKNIYKMYDKLTEEFFSTNKLEQIKSKSQYFTPAKEAERLIEDLEIKNKKNIKILDPSCGNGILVLKLLEKILKNYKPECIFIDLYDIEKILLKNVETMIRVIENNGIKINVRYINRDFLESNYNSKYDYIVMNPPFKKINIKNVPEDMVDFVYGQPNLYHLFIKRALDLLEVNGILCVLSPKNYLSGRYTEHLRNYIVDNFSIIKISTFNDRKNIFKNNITQEICMLHIKKSKEENVVISYNDGIKFEVKITDVISKNKNKIIFTPRNINDYNLIKSFSKFPIGTIGNEILVKVGKVVQFRVKEKEKNLVNEEFNKYKKGIPLIVYRHIRGDKIEYGKLIDKSKNDAITLIDDGLNKSLLIKNGNYVLIRKNVDKKYEKLIHSVMYFNELDSDSIAIDNGLIYFTNKDDSLTENEVIGLQCILKSKQFDDYYRMMNSTHTINVYELENINFPSLDIIKEIGCKAKKSNINVKKATKIFQEYL